ncbi:MAG: response regulator [Deltaproteobacteria bacterium]|nr:response regulator [Deltaproteobacteria bacterium]
MTAVGSKGLQVLVAEDDLEIADMVRSTLESAGYEVTLVHDGEEALRAALANKPDLVILDVMMPQMNGWEVCKALRARAEMSDVGIMMLTAIGPNLNEMTAPLYGADDHLDKPFVITELLERVAALAEKVRGERDAVVAP